MPVIREIHPRVTEEIKRYCTNRVIMLIYDIKKIYKPVMVM